MSSFFSSSPFFFSASPKLLKNESAAPAAPKASPAGRLVEIDLSGGVNSSVLADRGMTKGAVVVASSDKDMKRKHTIEDITSTVVILKKVLEEGEEDEEEVKKEVKTEELVSMWKVVKGVETEACEFMHLHLSLIHI